MNLLPRSVAAWLLSATLSTPALAADPSTSALLKDIHALQRATLHSASGMTPMGGTLFFNHTDSRTGSELWRTDGTPGGTALVKDLAPGLYGSHPDDFIEARGSLFFSTARSFEGSELWKTDGTAAGTVRLKHLGEAALADREIVGSTYYFVLESSDTGYHELWKSDGTAAGTTRVTDLGKGSQRVRLQYLKAVGGTLYFVASYPDRHEELWKSDGTEAGTVLVRSGVGLGSFVRFSNLMDLGGTLVLGVISGGMSQLWKSDGTGAGTVKLADIPMTPQEYALGNGRLFFIAGDALWTSDGTPAGTVSLKFFTNVQARSLVVRNGVLFLSASDDASSDTPRLWKSDGTPGGTTRVLDLPLSDGYAGMALAQGTLFFVGREATTDSLWKSDGTPAGTVKLKELTTDEAPRVYMMTAAGGNVFFQHTVTTSAEPELWKSDGTAAGTGPVHKAPAEPLGSNASRWTQLGNSLLFFANDGVHGFEPWKTEGTADSTVLLKDTEPADALATFGQSASRFVVRDTTAFFLSMSESTQRLWKTDGTGAGTVLVKEFPYTRFSSPMESDLVLIGQTLYFAAQDAAHGTELWKSDGTPEGTVLVKDVHAGTESGTGSWLRHVNGTLLFLADDG
ncbi:ELWxxDGT repeat protein, partial [Archangium sp.]|uniref:ELWxxDGT repeat protein n=1 Tax=Archangium sp. TaxID=1872627 RepID=UPI002ED92D85